MCTLIALLRVVPGYPVVVAMNRDERYDRPAIAPQLLGRSPSIVAPRDAEADGTWIGVNEFGLVAALSNRIAGHRDPQARSRGLLCLESLTRPDAVKAAAFAADEADTRTYNPFNLLHVDARAIRCTSRERGTTFVRAGGEGTNVLSNDGLNAGDLRAHRVEHLLRSPSFATLDDAVESLRAVLADHREAGGRAICFHGDIAGTRSQTIVAVSAQGWSHNRLWYTEGYPCTALPKDLSDRFR